jgi:hypothetical protein
LPVPVGPVMSTFDGQAEGARISERIFIAHGETPQLPHAQHDSNCLKNFHFACFDPLEIFRRQWFFMLRLPCECDLQKKSTKKITVKTKISGTGLPFANHKNTSKRRTILTTGTFLSGCRRCLVGFQLSCYQITSTELAQVNY